MQYSSEYRLGSLGDLRRAYIRSWLSTLVSLGKRAIYSASIFAVEDLSRDINCKGQLNPPSEQHIVDNQHPTCDADRYNFNHTQPLGDASSDQSSTNTPSSADTPDALAAGIEVKFLLPVLKPGTADHNHEDGRPILRATEGEIDDHQALIRRVHDTVAPTIQSCHTTAGAAVPQKAVTLHDITARGLVERDHWDEYWIVKKANSAEPKETEKEKGEDYVWVPVEVCSPKQRWNAQDGLGNSLRSITSVLRALTTYHRVTVNYTCDVHVHIGRVDGRHLSLNTLQRLATMLWLAEDSIRTIRDPDSPNFRNVYTWGAELRTYSRLAGQGYACGQFEHQDSPLGLEVLGNTPGVAEVLKELQRQAPAIRAIWNARNHMELGKLLSGSTAQYRRLGFNFSSLGEEDERARTGPKTVEFRVLEGTLDQAVICAWIRICWSLVEVAGEECAGKAADGNCRFVKVVKCCLGDVGADNCGRDGEDRNPITRKQDCRGQEQHTEARVLRGRFRTLVVDGLGLRGDVYEAFAKALLRRRRSICSRDKAGRFGKHASEKGG